jgi:chromosomal replication initiation ATPase DnaA
MTDPVQLALPLPTREALGREDFYVTKANAMAVSQIEGWALWPARKAVLCGPARAGKTHLAHVWAKLSNAQIVPAASLPDQDIPALAAQPVCVEDVDKIAGQRDVEEALFHLHNLVLAQGHALLMTATTPPAQWGLTLPDLQSRADGAQIATLDKPDDDLLAALIAKLFADRQIVPAPDVIPFLARRIPRNYAAIQQMVEELDAAALTRPKGVSRPLAMDVMDRLAPETDRPQNPAQTTDPS